MQSVRRIPLRIEARNRSTDAEGDFLLNPGDFVTMTYYHDGTPNFRHALRIVGEAGAAWQERCEASQPVIWYRSLEDALNREIVCNDEMSLHLKGRGESFERNAWLKIPGDYVPKTRVPLDFSVWACTKNLKLDLEGQVGAFLEIYHHRKNRHPDDVHDAPDRVLALPLEPGTYGWIRLTKKLTGLDKIAALLVKVGGVRFSGEAFFSTPVLLNPGQGNLIRPFNAPAPPYQQRNWLGENLSRKEWPEFAITVNGQTIFHGPAFCCITRDPDLEFPIPERLLKKGNNKIEIALRADYPSAPSYVLRRAEILRETARAFEIVAAPEYARARTETPVLIEINRPGTTLRTSDGQKQKFSTPGLHVLRFDSDALAQGLRISDDTRTEKIAIKRAVEKSPDVLLGTGDAVYVSQTVDTFKRYLKWYLSEGIGNFITFRPVYRWCGSREFSPAAWAFAVDLLNKLDMAYALMVNGRELPGKRVCPSNDLLAGLGYKGRQSHEADGAFKYWGAYAHEDPFFREIMQRSSEPDGIFPGVRPTRHKGRFFPFHATNYCADMKSGAEYCVRNLRPLAKTATRHTGPSALFRYFYQAGFKFLGAEQMYCAEDVVLAALRGASKAYGKSDFGAHLAVQWSSAPLDDPAHFRRYALSLACCYLAGVTQINTEEGLYRMENAFAREDRFGKACTGHRQYHAKFRRFIATRERRGSIHVPFGILHGRYDSWTCFSRGPAWDQEDPSMRFGPPEESFDLLKVFYPRCRLDAIYRGGCPNKPQGWYSGAPYGPVDILPIEASRRIFHSYNVLAFLGWNTFNERDFANLSDFVKAGGTLLLARPHAAANIRRFDPSQLPNSSALRELLGPAIHAKTRVERNVGKGKVIFHGQDSYPAEPAIRAAYEKDLHALARQVVDHERTRGWIAGNDNIDFAVYDHGDLRAIYLLNIAWWRPKTEKAGLLLGKKSFPIEVPFGSIRVVTVAGDRAVYPMNDDVDVLGVDEMGFSFQAGGPSSFKIFNTQKQYNLTASPGRVLFR